METIISKTREILGREAAVKGAGLIREALKTRGEAGIIVATGASQFDMLSVLVKDDIDWSLVT
ncbi:MAG TPA: hypothetical protein PLO24_12375, partial [Bacteroidales bacterium]|nr:hypothetical protein [Bacteroidales bacterium]